MDPLYDAICHGCLNSERKISNLNDSGLKECFKHILKATTALSYDMTLQLCFECVAILVKIKRFQERVKISSEKLLNECLKKNHSHSQTSLQTNNLYNISLSEHKDTESYDVIHSKPIIQSANENSNDYDFENDLERDVDVELSKQDQYDTDLSIKDICTDDILSKKEIYTEVKLSKKEIEEERLALKLSDEYANAMFKCDKCVITFTNVDDLDEHVSGKHDVKSKYLCSICKCVFNSTISFKYHTNRHKKRYQCSVCNVRFVYKRDVIKHYNIIHCHGVENLIYDNETQAQTTEIAELSQKQGFIFACDVCEKQFRWKASLRKHLERHRIESGQKRKPYCEPCKLYFATSANLKKHVRTSSKHQIQLKLRKLKDSNEEDKSDAIKEIRSSINSSRQTFSCAQCDKRFQWYGNLMRHMNNHKAKASGELVCVPCNRSFSSIATYQQHMKISKKHVTENDFKYMCSDCGKRFADKTRLKDHVDWEHLKNFVHTCSECQKPFKTRTSLYLHKQVVHQKDTSEHLCDHCGKHFPNHSKLRIHIRAVHSAVAAYKCSSCGAKFAWHSCLSRHIRRLHKKIT